VLINARLQGDGLEAECGILTRGERQSTSGTPYYEPTICVGGYPRNAGHSVASIPYREVLLALTRPW
jgi:hypothetical protein